MRAVSYAIPLAAVGLGVWLLSTSAPTPAPAPASAASDLRYAWPAGTGYRYQLDFDSKSAVKRFTAVGRQATPALEGAFRVVGDLELRSHGVVAGQTRLALRFRNPSTARIKLLDRELLTAPKAIATHITQDTAWLSVDGRGRISQIGFAPDSSHLFRNLVQLVTSEVWIELGAGAEWTRVAKTQHGEAETRFVRHDTTIERSRARYRSLQAQTDDWTATVAGKATARIESNGPLLTVAGHETVTATDGQGTERLNAANRFEMRLVERFAFVAEAPPTGLVALAPGESSERADAWAQHMEQRIAGLTPDALLNTLAENGLHGKLPQHEKFLWRAAALLRTQPELCDRLAELFESEAMGDGGRMLILDLLTHSGAPGSQAALRRILDGDVAEASAQYIMMYQRLGLVRRPDAETAAMARARYRHPGPEGPHAAAYTLGSVAGHSQDLATSRAIAARLERDLLEAKDQKQRRSLIFALGNAKEGARTIRGFVEDAHPELRYAAAAALRHQRDAKSRSALISMTADEEHRVAQRALRSLGDSALTAEELRQIAGLVAAGRVNEVALHALLNVLTPHRNEPVVEAILRRILTLKLKDSRVKGRIRAMLGEA